MNNDHHLAWGFSFALESGDGRQLSRDTADELFDVIIAWAEARGHQIGGGYRGVDNDASTEDVFPLREE
ncbi:hypothetical protein LVB87_07130 [Lysobacter sp. KIS68-7]|uniref:hypothetical protein n=1 Tax=Lysobacter sp. KIS68-7 TaxID=2904252 RepID=UPI001E5A99D5|nr:hypothetical protein [Lysobacter sp. KIS68-7]UHQ20901.1 hypothetical protein LVB87_07130 [Lysobacter sp. KIS68-7]